MFARRLTVVRGALVLLAACGGPNPGSRWPGEPAPVRGSEVVTQEELGKVSASPTLYEALQALRPTWFRRSPTSLRPDKDGDVVVYLDQSRLGGAEALRTIRVDAVTLVRHYSASEAEARFGLGNVNGAIQVVTTR